MVGDAGSSAAIIVGALAIRYTGWQVIDPALSILIGIAIVWSGWGIIRDSLNILLEGLPKGLNLTTVSARTWPRGGRDRRARPAHLEPGLGVAAP